MDPASKAEPRRPARPSLMGEAPRLALLLLPLLGAALGASLAWPRAFSFLGRLRGAGLALGLELGALGLLFWLSAAFGLVRAYRAGGLATRGAYGLCRHPIFAWWIFSLLPALALCLDSWPFLALALLLRLLAGPAAKREEAELERRFGEEYAGYRSRTRAFLPLPRFLPFRPRRCLKAAAALALLGLFALAALFLLVAPVVTELGATRAEREASWPDQALLRGRAGAFSRPSRSRPPRGGLALAGPGGLPPRRLVQPGRDQPPRGEGLLPRGRPLGPAPHPRAPGPRGGRHPLHRPGHGL